MANPQFHLSGKKDRCVWCGQPLGPPFITVDFKEGTKNAPTREVKVCNETCKTDLIETEKKFEGKAPVFIGALIWLLLSSTLSLILFSKHYNMLYLGIAGVLIMGTTAYFLPFVTPQTVQMMGYKKGFRLGRIAGIILIVVGILAGVLVYVTAPA